MVLKPGREDFAEGIFKKWELDFAVIGKVTETGHMVLKFNGETVCDIPLAPLADEAPLYDRPAATKDEYQAWAKVPPLGSNSGGERHRRRSAHADRLARYRLTPLDLGAVRHAGRRGHRSSAPAATRRWCASTVRDKGLAMSTDCTPRYCYADPYEGREASDRRMLSQPVGGRRDTTRGHQLPQLCHSAAA